MSGLRRIDQIRTQMERFTGRPWSAEDTAVVLTLAIPEAVSALGFRLAASRITVALPVDADRVALPSGFLGAICVAVDGNRFERVALPLLNGGGRRYALQANWLTFAPAGGVELVLDYRGIERTGGSGDGVSIDRQGEISFDMTPSAGTEADPDAYGRYVYTIDGIPGSLDEIDAHFNAIGQLMDLHPGVFMYGALKHASVMVQNDEGAARYGGLQSDAIANARATLLDGEWGAEKLVMRRA